MAESVVKPPTETVQVETKKLKYLDFVQVAAVYVGVFLSTVYDYVIDNSGPLKSVVQTVEGIVRAVIGPVYDKLHGVSIELLYFVDRKVDVLITVVDRHLPSLIKQALRQVRAVVSEVQRTGLVDTVRNILKTVYIEYVDNFNALAVLCAIVAWRCLNCLPLVRQVAHILVATAAYWFVKYNQIVAYLAEKGYTVSYYMPLIPVVGIAKLFAIPKNGPTCSTNAGSVAVAHFD